MNNSSLWVGLIVWAGSLAVLVSPALEGKAEGCGGNQFQVASDGQVYGSPLLIDTGVRPTNAPLLLRVAYKDLTPEQLLAAVYLQVTQAGTPVEGVLSLEGQVGPSQFYVGAQEALVLWRPVSSWLPDTTYTVEGAQRESDPLPSKIEFSTGSGPLTGVTPGQVTSTQIVRQSRLSGELISCYSDSPGFGCEYKVGSDETFYPTLATLWTNDALSDSEKPLYVHRVLPSSGTGTGLISPEQLVVRGYGGFAVKIAFQEPTGTYCYRLETKNLADGQSVISDSICVNGPMTSEVSGYNSLQYCGYSPGGADGGEEAFAAKRCAAYQAQCTKDCAQSPEGCGTDWCKQTNKICGSNQGGSDQGGSDQGGSDQGGSDQGGSDQGGTNSGQGGGGIGAAGGADASGGTSSGVAGSSAGAGASSAGAPQGEAGQAAASASSGQAGQAIAGAPQGQAGSAQVGAKGVLPSESKDGCSTSGRSTGSGLLGIVMVGLASLLARRRR